MHAADNKSTYTVVSKLLKYVDPFLIDIRHFDFFVKQILCCGVTFLCLAFYCYNLGLFKRTLNYVVYNLLLLS